jgi:hypothetical protein
MTDQGLDVMGDEVYALQQQYQKNGRLGTVALCASLCGAVTTAAPGACPSSERMCGTVTACLAVCHHPIIQIHVHNIPQAGWNAHPRFHSSGCDSNAGTPSSASAQPRTASTVASPLWVAPPCSPPYCYVVVEVCNHVAMS